MNMYVSNIVESYKDTVIGHLGNTGTSYLLLHIVQCCITCEVTNMMYLYFLNEQLLCLYMILQ